MASFDPRVVDVDGYVHVVCGKVVLFKKGVYDLESPDDLSKLIDFAENFLYVVDYLRPEYGRNTVCEVIPSGEGQNRRTVCMYHIDNVDEPIRSIIRGACHAYD